MSNLHIKNNLKLSGEFTNYIVKHPGVMKGVPKNACIVFVVESEPTFTKRNIAIARKLKGKEKEACYTAEKKSTGWKVSQLELSRA